MSSKAKRASAGSTYSSSKKRRNRDLTPSSGSQSDSDNETSRRKSKTKSAGKSKRNSDQSDDAHTPSEDEDEDDGDEHEKDDKVYEVEIIKSHRFDKKEGVKYKVGWKDWSPSNDTWEPLRNLNGALDLVKQYRLEHNLDPNPRSGPRASDASGRSSAKKAKATTGEQSEDDDHTTRKRKRSSQGKPTSMVAPVRKNGINGPTKADRESVKNRQPLPSDSEGSAVDSMDDDQWHAKQKKHSSWEELIRSVRTIEKPSAEDGDTASVDTINVCLLWKTGRTSWVSNKTARAKLPQKLLDFYEDHLQFSTADE